ncbi:Cutinase [Mycolicibacterium chubuense NBB4]|uniref:Cutinase n=1 Tax=Mycolicibacterium chubuense (strain NBB4) TaxID=710421 RepID=I4BKC9_MYCCN|nr:cutinase family protein [Mycolicibacterium chubuense]AFM17736.1 Cutinase [Mycolicibacterium chubuense NBB4]
MGLSGHFTAVHRRALAVAAGAVLVPLSMPAASAQPGPAPGPALPAPPPPAPVAAPASAAPPGCPDVQVIFARGTTEAPGLGAMGQAFTDDLRERVGNKTVGVYPVDYPASPDFPTAIQGIVDASTHVQQTATNCPNTKMVLGGYSQGAAVMGFVTTELIPDGVSLSEVPKPMPPDVANHVAAVTLLGTPSDRFMNVIKQPPVKIGTLYQPKTIELCVPDDFVCSPGNDIGAHARYISDGLVVQAADFAAGKLTDAPAHKAAPGAPAVPVAPGGQPHLSDVTSPGG